MSDPQNTLDNWQLKEAKGRTLRKWQLREAGPEALGYLQLLQENASAADWQPVEYTRGQASRPGWILPSVVGLVLVAISGYLIWIGINQLGFGSTTTAIVPPSQTGASAVDTGVVQNPTAEEPVGVDAGQGDAGATDTNAGDAGEPAAVVAVPADTPTPLPTPILLPEPTPLAEAEPILVERTIAKVTAIYGVNVRSEPSSASELLFFLEEEDTGVVLDASNADWLQVQVEDEESGETIIGWISSEFTELQSDLVPATPEEIAALSAAAEPETPAVEEPVAEEPAVEEAAPEGDAPAEETVIAPPAESVFATITAQAGLTARTEPNADSGEIEILDEGTKLTVLSQSDDKQWVEVALEDGRAAWVSAEFVAIEGDIAALNAQPVAENSEVEAVVEEPVEVVRTGFDPPKEPFSDIIPNGAAIIVENEYGVNARTTSSLDGNIVGILPRGAALPVMGRLDSSEWVQVRLPNGWVAQKTVDGQIVTEEVPDNALAWVSAQTVKTANIDTAPVAVPPAIGAPVEIYEEPIEEVVVEPTPEPEIIPEAEAEAVTATAPATDEGDGAVEEATDESAAAPSEESTEAVADVEEPTAEESGTEEPIAEESEPVKSDPAKMVFTKTVPDGPAIVVKNFIGINARTEPNAKNPENIIIMMPTDVALPVIGRNEVGDWVQVTMPDNTNAWVFTQAVRFENVAIEELPIVEAP